MIPPENPQYYFQFEPGNPLHESLERFTQIEGILQNASGSVSLLNEHSMNITGADIDLSCLKPIKYIDAIIALKYLAPTLGIHAVDLDSYTPNKIAEMVTTVIFHYRHEILINLINIKPYYDQVQTLLQTVGPERYMSHDMREALIAQELFMVPDDMFVQSILRNDGEHMLHSFGSYIHEIWAPMFDDRFHRQIAKNYLRDTLAKDELEATFTNMNKPRFVKRRK
jgi:hypothetical protein